MATLNEEGHQPKIKTGMRVIGLNILHFVLRRTIYLLRH